MSWLTILLFFIYTWGLGYSITRWFKQADNFFERNIMAIGIGLASIPLIGILLSIAGIPLNWWVFLLLSIAIPTYDFVMSATSQNNKGKHDKHKYPKFEFKLTKSNIFTAIVLMLFFANLYIYASGAFAYPWLEDDDPWHHASSVKYISEEKTVNVENPSFMYLSPYPPGYDLVLGILNQTSDSLFWVLKFFNALLISLGILFFYFFAKKILNDSGKALFATFILSSIPSYLSHFIWSHGFAMTLFIVSLYCVFMIDDDKWNGIVAAVVISGSCLTDPTNPIKFAIVFAIIIIVKWISDKKFNFYLAGSVVLGYLLSIVWWATRWKEMFAMGPSGQEGYAIATSGNEGFFLKIFHKLQHAFPPNSGSATRPYTFDDIVFAKSQNMINNPIGIGWVVSILIVLGLIAAIIHYRKLLHSEKSYLLIISLFGIYAFLGFNTMTFNLPFGLYSFRFWMVFAIPASLLAAEGMWLISENSKNIGVPKIALVFVIIIGVLFTSAWQKYSVNTAMWGYGQGWSGPEELKTYLWMHQNLPADTKVFVYTDPVFLAGFDMNNCLWCSDEKKFLETAFSLPPAELHTWLKSKGYQYMVVGGRDVRKFGANETTAKLMELQKSGFFSGAYGTSGAVVIRVN